MSGWYTTCDPFHAENCVECKVGKADGVVVVGNLDEMEREKIERTDGKC